MNPLTFIADLVSGLAAFFRIKEKADDRANSPAMQANSRAKQDAEIRAAALAAVKADELERIRKLASE
jgi:hypothetical protein